MFALIGASGGGMYKPAPSCRNTSRDRTGGVIPLVRSWGKSQCNACCAQPASEASVTYTLTHWVLPSTWLSAYVFVYHYMCPMVFTAQSQFLAYLQRQVYHWFDWWQLWIIFNMCDGAFVVSSQQRLFVCFCVIENIKSPFSLVMLIHVESKDVFGLQRCYKVCKYWRTYNHTVASVYVSLHCTTCFIHNLTACVSINTMSIEAGIVNFRLYIFTLLQSPVIQFVVVPFAMFPLPLTCKAAL